MQRSMLAGYLCLLLAPMMVVLILAWAARQEIREARRAVLRAETARLRSHAERTVGRIESTLEDQPGDAELAAVRDADWLRDFWRRIVPREGERSYAALVDDHGVVVMHSDHGREGQRTGSRWFEQTVPEAGDDVVKTRNQVLSSGRLAYDVRVPVNVGGREIGAYHSGFDAAWLEHAVADQEQRLYTRWLVIGGLLALVVAGAGWFLFRLAGRAARLQQALSMQRTQQLAELGRLAGSLAHEIRNPLNAIRLNLHALSRLLGGRNPPFDGEAQHVVQESNVEIERLESLVRSVLDYARPKAAQADEVDVKQELQATLGFLRQALERGQIAVRLSAPDEPVTVLMDRDRLRQMMLNLMNNAQEAAGRGGAISIALTRADGWAQLCISDTGKGVAPADRKRVFEPFFTTKHQGCGLGLALVKRFAEEAGGTVTCESNGRQGSRFRVCLPETA